MLIKFNSGNNWEAKKLYKLISVQVPRLLRIPESGEITPLSSFRKCNIRPKDTYRRKIKLGSETTGQRLNRALHAFHRLYQASYFGGLFNIGSTKTLLFSGFDQSAQINLITCRNSELMAGSQYPQTTRSLLKSGLLLFFELLLFLLSR